MQNTDINTGEKDKIWEIGKRLKALRKKLGLTQKEFAERVEGKIDYTYIGKIEREEQYPSLKMLQRIAKAFSVPLSYFFEEESPLESLELLPQELKELLKDKKRQDLLRKTQRLTKRDLSLVMQIIDVLSQTPPSRELEVAEEKAKKILDCQDSESPRCPYHFILARALAKAVS